MPGRNCAFPQCTSSETEKHAGVKYFQITTRKSEYYDYNGWRERITNILSRYRVIGRVEKERIAKGKVYICDRHYAEEDIEYSSKSELCIYFAYLCFILLIEAPDSHVLIWWKRQVVIFICTGKWTGKCTLWAINISLSEIPSFLEMRE